MSSSTNTAARATIAELAKIGYVQSIRGKGVIVIYQGKAGSKEFSLGSIETMREAAERNHKTYRTKVEVFTTFPVDERISKRTGFDVGETVYYAQRVRFFDERPVILDNNWFLARIVKDLTPEICEKSVYQYMEHELGENIVTAKRVLTVEKATQVDRKYLDLRDFDCVAVVTSHTFNARVFRTGEPVTMKMRAARLSKVCVLRTGEQVTMKMRAARLFKVRILRTGEPLTPKLYSMERKS